MSDDEINFPRLLKNGITVGKKCPKRGGGWWGGDMHFFIIEQIKMHKI